MTTTLALTSFPPGVLAHTFSFLGLEEFARHISPTCKAFKGADNHLFMQCARETERLMNLGPQLYLFTQFSAHNLHKKRSRREVVDLMKGLRTFHIQYNVSNKPGCLKNEQEFETELNDVLASERMPAITTLQVGVYDWNSFQNATLSKILARFPSLEDLTFYWLRDKVTDEQLATHLRDRVDLRRLTMIQCSGARDVTIDTIVKMHKLSFLSLAHCQGITHTHVEKVLDLDSLTGLDVSVSSKMPDASIREAHEKRAEVVAAKGSRLTSLTIENTQCSSESLELIAKQCSSLLFINIMGSSCLDSDPNLGRRMASAKFGLRVYTKLQEEVDY